MVIAGSMSKDYDPEGGSLSVDGLSSIHQCQSVEEWRSCEQVENGMPSTSPHLDSDGDDSGPKPSELYGKFTWKIENFSQISKRELRSNAFEVGGYKWYILIYPQGCDACNHLSLFLCVANHDKLHPGWSHFALFTIAVVNKDPKKNKYNDTLHRFCKKEHDWGWKKFMELNKVTDGFVADDTLTIKAQVQVIREKAHRPFRCLDCQYRRELIRVYLSAVEKSCAEFVNERRLKLQALIGDRAKWSSFHAFWIGIDLNTRRHMSRDKADDVLKEAVKNFFIEKEVLSTLVMDSLYSSLKALEIESKRQRNSLLEMEDFPLPIIFIENDMFVLADDVFRLLERASVEFSHLPLHSKEEKGLPIRAKDGCSGDEFSRDSILRDERRLTELGRRMLEIFVLAHIFSKIEIAYQEAIALKRQEELIREEEEAEQAENVKREKRAKKKQARQRRNSRKGKDIGKDEKSMGELKEKHQLKDYLSDDIILEDFSSEHGQQVNEKNDLREDVLDVSDPRDDGAEALQPDGEDRDSSPLNWDADTSEINPTAEACGGENSNDHLEKKSPSVVDDSSSTCSTDSVPSVVVNGPYKGKSPNNKNKRNSSNRGKSQQNKGMRNISTSNKDTRNSFTSNADRLPHLSGCRAANGRKSDGNIHCLNDEIQRLEQQKECDTKPGNRVTVKDQTIENKDQTSGEIPSRTSVPSSSSASPTRKPLSTMQSVCRHTTTGNEQVCAAELASNTPIQSDKSSSRLVKTLQDLSIFKSDALKHTTEAMTSGLHQSSSISRPSSAPVIPLPEPNVPRISMSQIAPQLTRTPQDLSIFKSDDLKHTTEAMTSGLHQSSSISRPSSAPVIPVPEPTVPHISTSRIAPQLSRTLSSTGRLDFEPLSYRNAIMGIKTTTGSNTSEFSSRPSLSSSTQPTTSFETPTSSSSSLSSYPLQCTVSKGRTSTNSGFSFGSGRQGSLHNPHQWTAPSLHLEDNMRNGINLESVHQSQGDMTDEFPHIDIINDLLDEDQIVGRTSCDGYQQHDDFHPMNHQYAFPGDLVMSQLDSMNNSYQFGVPDQYYYDEMSQMVHDSFVPLHEFGHLRPQQPDFSGYGNGMDGWVQSQWPVGSADLLNFGGMMDANGYAYQQPEYSACSVGGYNMVYQPANGI